MPFTTLVAPQQLDNALDDPSWIIFDCRHSLADPAAGRRAYAEAHIPGAYFLHLDEDLSGQANGRNGRHPLPDPEAFAARLAALGMGDDKQAVAYDDGSATYAARLWWMLRWLGHEQVAVLDGGWENWVGERRPVTLQVPQARPNQLSVNLRDHMRIDSAFLEQHLLAPELCLIDARSPERFHGIGETLDPVGGHIPGAQNRFFRDNLDGHCRFKPAEELRRAYQSILHELPPDAAIHQCGSGVSACNNILAMEIAGLPNSKLYPGSWSEWCADPRRPIAQT